MENFKCVACQGERSEPVIETIILDLPNDKKVTVDDVPATKCLRCGELYFDKQANKYIDEKLRQC